jgi:hypothetical protein
LDTLHCHGHIEDTLHGPLDRPHTTAGALPGPRRNHLQKQRSQESLLGVIGHVVPQVLPKLWMDR